MSHRLSRDTNDDERSVKAVDIPFSNTSQIVEGGCYHGDLPPWRSSNFKSRTIRPASFRWIAIAAIAFIAIIVVFQPELRRALMRIGETRLFRSKTAQVNELVEALVESSAYLSKRRIGALIAIGAAQ